MGDGYLGNGNAQIPRSRDTGLVRIRITRGLEDASDAFLKRDYPSSTIRIGHALLSIRIARASCTDAERAFPERTTAFFRCRRSRQADNRGGARREEDRSGKRRQEFHSDPFPSGLNW